MERLGVRQRDLHRRTVRHRRGDGWRDVLEPSRRHDDLAEAVDPADLLTAFDDIEAHRSDLTGTTAATPPVAVVVPRTVAQAR